jgi:formylglycine-generating enzyme required for sulfatase activity
MLGTVLPAQAERRVALIIGNSQYQSVPKLANPANDAEAMATSLKALGFEQVTVRLDLGYDQFISTLRDFAREADKADWALVYYSGHGIEVGGVNYMIPVDAHLKTDRDVELEAVDINKVLTAVERASKLRIVILDACRDNPFASQIKRTVATRSIGHGLSRIEPGAGTLVVYAAKHGETALDGDGKNSPFAASLLSRIDTPNLEVRRLFDVVRDDVMERTRGQQQPFAYGSLSGREDYYFRTAAAVASATAPQTTTPPVAPSPQPRSGGAAKDCPNCPDMVSIPKGTFTMGASSAEEDREKLPKDEQGHSSPQRAVTISKAFSLGRTEVTRGQYAVFATATGRPMGSSCWSLGLKEGESGEKEGRNWHNPGFAQTDDAPVLCVSWEDAKAYVDWLTRTTGKPYRLPTEAEWEYAARARTTTARYWGDERHVACRYANVADRSLVQLGGYDNSPDQFFQCSDGYSNTAPVGRFQANAFGLYDMIGNVSEWVEDCWNDDHQDAPNGQEARYSGDCTHRVIRGGSWYSTPATARAAFRWAELYQNHADDLGFRVARSD